MSEEPTSSSEDFDQKNLDASKSQHPDKKKEPDSDEKKGEKSPSQGKLSKAAGAVAGQSQTANKAMEMAKIAKDAARAMAGDVTAMASLALKALKDPKMVFGMLGCSCFTIFLPIFFVVFLVILIAASSSSISQDKDSGLCKRLSTLSLGKEVTDMLNNVSYNAALKDAEEKTGASHLLIEAVDYEENNMGINDRTRDNAVALESIGNKLQQANYRRDVNGHLALDATGKPIKSLPNITGKAPENIPAAMALINYYCVFVEHKDQSGNLSDPAIETDCFGTSKDECLKKGIQNQWMVSSSGEPIGAYLFYIYLSKSLVCKTGPSSPTPGKPGECKRDGGGSVASVPSFFQFDPRWQVEIDGSGEYMNQGGCGLTSITMVLNWYGKNVTPLDTINFLNANPPVPYGGLGWSTDMYDKVAQNYGMTAEVNTLAWSDPNPEIATVETKLRNCEPVVVGITGGGWAYPNHLVVLTGIDGAGNVHINDPFPIDNITGQFTEPISAVQGNIGNKIYVHN